MNNSYSYQGYGSYMPNSYTLSSNYNNGNVVGRDDRIIGSGFVFPFLLGGVTGASIAPAFWRPPYNRPFYGPGFYGPGFYGPYRPF